MARRMLYEEDGFTYYEHDDGWIEVEPGPWHADPVVRFFMAITLGFVIMFFVGLVGELMGVWNDTGEALMSGGTLGSVAGVAIGLFAGASRRQVRVVGNGVRMGNANMHGVRRSLDSMDEKLDKLDKLDGIETGQAEQTAILREIRDRL